MNTTTMKTNTNEKAKPRRHEAEVDEELVLGGKVHGVTFDGTLVWYASDDALVGVDPKTRSVARKIAVPAEAGTAFDGAHLYQLANDKILVVDPKDGRVVREMPAPAKGRSSGMAYSDGFLWIGDHKDGRIHKVDARTGDVSKTLASDRWVTGVSCVDGALWHATGNDGRGGIEIRRLADDGTVEEILEVSGVRSIGGLEGDGNAEQPGFWCAGEDGKLRHVRRASDSRKAK